jgi:hypothetical protein
MTVLGVLFVVGSLWAGGCKVTTIQAPAAESPQVQPPQAQAQDAETPAKSAEPAPTTPVQEPKPKVVDPTALAVGQEISLFDGQTLGQWKPTDFGGQGNVSVKDGAIQMALGSYMTGITWTGPMVRENYEISLEAMRVEGNDFFCGLTFPVGDRPCTLVLGGWGGSVCGLSSIDYFDASENQTTRIISFEKGKWYRVQLRVEGKVIQAWLDDEELVNFDSTDHKLGIRAEVDLSQPLGIATWCTAGAVRDIRVKKLPEPQQTP